MVERAGWLKPFTLVAQGTLANHKLNEKHERIPLWLRHVIDNHIAREYTAYSILGIKP